MVAINTDLNTLIKEHVSETKTIMRKMLETLDFPTWEQNTIARRKKKRIYKNLERTEDPKKRGRLLSEFEQARKWLTATSSELSELHRYTRMLESANENIKKLRSACNLRTVNSVRGLSNVQEALLTNKHISDLCSAMMQSYQEVHENKEDVWGIAAPLEKGNRLKAPLDIWTDDSIDLDLQENIKTVQSLSSSYSTVP